MRKTFFLTAILLPISFITPLTKEVWHALDEKIFFFFNSYVAYQPLQRIFWAFANIKITDIYGAFFIVGAFFLYIYEGKGKERRQRYAHFVYTLIWFEITTLFSKQFYNPICEYLALCRHSPTVIYEHAFRLSRLVSWIKIKDLSFSCFPGDHATITFVWCSFFWFFAGWKRGLLVTSVSLLFLLPRLISGAHWMSDICVGSIPIVICATLIATRHFIINLGLAFLYRCVQYMPSHSKGEYHVSASN